jgi:hypothetical protein
VGETKQNASMKPQFAAAAVHPDEIRRDLNPDTMAGQNIATAGPHQEKSAKTAYDIKALHARYRDWSDGDLKQIPVLPAGSRLEQNATYIDLAAAEVHELTGMADMEAGGDHLYVPKSDVPYELWNRLLGLTDVRRTGVAQRQ